MPVNTIIYHRSKSKKLLSRFMAQGITQRSCNSKFCYRIGACQRLSWKVRCIHGRGAGFRLTVATQTFADFAILWNHQVVHEKPPNMAIQRLRAKLVKGSLKSKNFGRPNPSRSPQRHEKLDGGSRKTIVRLSKLFASDWHRFFEQCFGHLTMTMRKPR